MPITPTARAQLYKVTGKTEPGENDPSVLTVQFNPTTLAYSVQNTLKQPEKDARAAQYVSQTSAKLELDLVFDSTHDGHDIRAETSRIKAFLDAGEHKKPEDAAPPVIGFRWGAFKFKGYIDQFRESLDFFSSDGVPLRSSVKLSLTAQNAKEIFAAEKFGKTKGDVDLADVKLVSVPAGGTSKMGSEGGNPNAGRGLAAANGFESMRNPGAALAAVASGGVQLKAAAAFSAGAGIGFGAGAGAGFGASAGAGFGAGGFTSSSSSSFSSFSSSSFPSASFSGGKLSFGAGAGFGGASSGGVSASAGAFAGLGPSRTVTSVTLNTGLLQTRTTTTTVTSDYAIGGRAVASASVGLTTNVGATARIRFD